MSTHALAMEYGERVREIAQRNGGDLNKAAETVASQLRGDKRRRLLVWALRKAEVQSLRVNRPAVVGEGQLLPGTHSASAPRNRVAESFQNNPLDFVVCVPPNRRVRAGDLTPEHLTALERRNALNAETYERKAQGWGRIREKVESVDAGTLEEAWAALGAADREFLSDELGVPVAA